MIIELSDEEVMTLLRALAMSGCATFYVPGPLDPDAGAALADRIAAERERQE